LSEELEKNPLWLILVETVHSLPMYASHKAYVRDRLVLEEHDITPEELSLRLDIPLGEAMVILHEISRDEYGGKSVEMSTNDT
jgi:hypothetical protein